MTKLEEAYAIVRQFNECSLRVVPGSGLTAYHHFARERGMVLVADAVRKVVQAKRLIDKHEREKAEKQ